MLNVAASAGGDCGYAQSEKTAGCGKRDRREASTRTAYLRM